MCENICYNFQEILSIWDIFSIKTRHEISTRDASIIVNG